MIWLPGVQAAPVFGLIPVVQKPCENTPVLGKPQLAWFRMLKNSARNWSVNRSDSLVFFITEKSMFQKKGPVSTFLPKFPNSPTGGNVNAAGLNHWLSVPVVMLLAVK